MEIYGGVPVGVLVIGENEKEALRRLKEYALQNVVQLETLLTRKPIGNNSNHVVVIPSDFRIVYSVEQQPAPLRLCRHMSISVSREGRAPIPQSINMVAEELEFRNNAVDTYTRQTEAKIDGGTELIKGRGVLWTENFADNRIAINFMEKMEI